MNAPLQPLVLVVEDNPVNLRLARTILEKSGYAVESAGDAEQGLARARELKPALVLMDVQLPGKDGLAATRELKADPATRHIPVVAITAFAMQGDEERMRAAGCDGYIAKPIRYKEFLAEVARRLERGASDG